MNEVFSKRIAEAVKKSKMSYSDLAKSADVSVNTISNCASGLCNPSINNVIKIARALDISLDYLCGFGAKKCISGLEPEKPPVTEVKTPPEIKRVYITRRIVFFGRHDRGGRCQIYKRVHRAYAGSGMCAAPDTAFKNQVEGARKMSDYINKADALNTVKIIARRAIDEGKHTVDVVNMVVEIIGKIAELPIIKVAPEGTWIDVMENYEVARCSRCGNEFDAIVPAEKASRECWEVFCNEYRYCPSCGAKMKKE